MSHRHGSRSAAAPAPLEDENLLAEILVRLPQRPSSLPRASLVSKQWCRVVADAGFLTRFREHHRTPPLHGFYIGGRFVPMLDPPDIIPAARFSLCPEGGDEADGIWNYCYCVTALACYRGLVLARDHSSFLVLDPMSGYRRQIPTPTPNKWVMDLVFGAAVVPLAIGGNRHKFCLVVLFSHGSRSLSASVYSSNSGVWDHSVATLCPNPPSSLVLKPESGRIGGTPVRDAIYWMLGDPMDGIVEYDLGRQSMALVPLPLNDVGAADCPMLPYSCRIMSVEDGLLGFAVIAGLGMQLWVREANHRWVLRKTVQPGSFLPPRCLTEEIAGFSEESNSIFLQTNGGVFIVQLNTMKTKKVLDNDLHIYHSIHPYSSF